MMTEGGNKRPVGHEICQQEQVRGGRESQVAVRRERGGLKCVSVAADLILSLLIVLPGCCLRTWSSSGRQGRR